MEIKKHYDPSIVEDKWYEHWLENQYFESQPDEREAYSIVIPPPNVTGVLHMGHMLNNTIQDILIRKARLDGKNACWVPGTDHASIATEAKVVKWLREKGLTKGEVGREKFLDYAFEWKEKYGGIILDQLKKLGASCDWSRTAFTMDEERSRSVEKAFVDLYNKGLLYRENRMVNWDPEAQTVLSNEEVIYKEENSKLYHLRYQIVGSDEYIQIATTRPETILADTGIAVHPEDQRYAHLKGKKAIVPLVQREIPIVFDDYVDQEFGTGALKITPAHDPNDYEIGKKHDLEVINIMNPDATFNADAQYYVGKDRFEVRKAITKDLEATGALIEIENYNNKVGRSERTNAVVEPRLSLQWYVDMKALAEPALEAVESNEVQFFPENQKNLYRHWMENIRDWCISRQLWWGHRIPAYYYKNETFVATSAEEALSQAQNHFNDTSITLEDLKQDEDVMDTWFSSWLWPMSVFNGFVQNSEELNYYYPTSVLVTGWDIIFLWVARMIMAGYEWKGKRPFDKVYFTGMVRDKQGRKMSKSLGNSPDALALIKDFGADGVRFGMLSSSPAGGDLLFDTKLVEQGRNFCNKMWNALRLIKGWELKEMEPNATDTLAIEWMEAKIAELVEQLNEDYEAFRLSEGLMKIYNLVWNDFCSNFLELVKPNYGDPISADTYEKVIQVYSKLMTLLHPFMPFITEEIWHLLKTRAKGNDCVVSSYPSVGSYDRKLINRMQKASQIITKVREIRASKGISPKESLELYFENSDSWELESKWANTIKKMANVSLNASTEIPDQVTSFVVDTSKYYVPIGAYIDLDAEREKLEKDLEYAEGFVKSVEKKLSNQNFVNNAPDAVVEKERKKLADGQMRVEKIKASLADIKG